MNRGMGIYLVTISYVSKTAEVTIFSERRKLFSGNVPM
ncbi:hypothetical protein KIS4809_1786 [Bacillus sp. ZZV12-4809]|nr:hypothetical protein KIS4809_1786 [Bacillus sp. ZZV12-4809]